MAKVLLVDDDPEILRTLGVALQAAGHEVCSAEGLEAALRLAPQCLPDVMVVDVMMPGGTEGFHLVWRIRQSESTKLRNVPIILVTEIHEHTELRFYPEHSDGTFKPGEFLPIQGWLDKPVEPAELLAAISHALGAPPGPKVGKPNA